MNILERANQIVNERSEEKERLYGPFIACNERAAIIATVLCGKEITTEDIYKFQIALKFAREAYAHNEDNLLDAVAYIGALNNFHNRLEPEVPEFTVNPVKLTLLELQSRTQEVCKEVGNSSVKMELLREKLIELGAKKVSDLPKSVWGEYNDYLTLVEKL